MYSIFFEVILDELSKLMPVTVAVTMHSHDKETHDGFAVKIKVIISPNGKVYPCTFYHKDIGDITRESLTEILGKAETKKIQKQFEQPQVCKDCDNSDFCPRCPVLCMSKKGSFSSILDSDCIIASECKKEVILNHEDKN